MKKLQLNKEYNNFKLIEKKESKDINSVFYTFIHNNLGTKLIYIQNRDNEKAFTVSFKTPSKDSKGYQHILEHSVLRSSKKYDFGNKEVFSEILRKSMPVFLNAATYPDKTTYPFSTTLESEFFKIMDIYNDAVFNPLLLENENFFRQEGWRWDKNKKGNYFINGVVFNEMKGRMSSIEVTAETELFSKIFPNTEYKHNSGGDPDKISDLKYEDLVKYHKEYYNPSNATFLIYGNLDIFKVLEKIDKNFLVNFKKVKKAPKTELQKRFKTKKYYKSFFPVSNAKKSSLLALGFLGEVSKKTEENFVISVLLSLVLNQNSPVYKTLMDSRLMSNISKYYEKDILEESAVIFFSGIDAKDRKKIEDILEKSLLEIVKNGIPKNIINEILNVLEYGIINEQYTTGRGLKIIDNILRLDLYNFNFYDNFEYRKKILYLKNVIKNKGLEKLIVKYFIKNNHTVSLLMDAKKDFNPYPKLTKKIESINTEKDKKKLEDINLSIAQFKEYQEKENPQNISELILPPKNKDLPKNPKKYKVSASNDKRYFFKKISSKEISACSFLFDGNVVKKEDIQYLKFLTSVLPKLAPLDLDREKFVEEISLNTADYSFSLVFYTTKSKQIKLKIVMDLNFLNSKEDKIFSMLSELFSGVFFDKKIILQEIDKNLDSIKNSLAAYGNFYTSLRSLSKVSEIDYLKEQIAGIEYYFFLKKLKKEINNDFDLIIDKFKTIFSSVFVKNDIKISHSANKKNINLNKKLNLQSKKQKSYIYNFSLKKENEALVFDGLSNSFNSIAGIIKNPKIDINKMVTLESFLRYGFLWDKIREEGGAYGSGISLNTREKTLCTNSYMDSRIEGTYTDYYKIGNHLKSSLLNDFQKDGIIAKSLNSFIQPESEIVESEKVLWLDILETDYQKRAKKMDIIKSFKNNDFQKMANDVEKTLKSGVKVTLASSDNIKNNKKLFDIITVIE